MRIDHDLLINEAKKLIMLIFVCQIQFCSHLLTSKHFPNMLIDLYYDTIQYAAYTMLILAFALYFAKI